MTHRPSKLDRSPSSLSLLSLSICLSPSPRSPRPPPTTALLPRRDLHCSFSVWSSHLAARPPPLHRDEPSSHHFGSLATVATSSVLLMTARQRVEEFTCGICPPPIDLATALCHFASVSLSRQVRNFLLGSMGRGRALAFLVALRTAEAGGEVVSHSPNDHDRYPSLCRNNWGRNLHHLLLNEIYFWMCMLDSFLLLLYFDGRWLSRLSCSDRRRLESGRRVTG